VPLSDFDRLRLENEALLRIVQTFANLGYPHLESRVQRARNALSAIKKRKKALKPRDEVEEACFIIVDEATRLKIEKPTISLSRYGKNEWEAFIEKFEGVEFIGVGMGNSPVEALRDLLGATRSYAARCKQGIEKHRAV
jgi:hypothetical protein